MKFDHPIIDTDGHLLEVIPHVAEYAREIGGAAVHRPVRGQAQPGLHADRGPMRLPGGPRRADALDRARLRCPSWLHDRLPELGIDFAVIYRRSGLSVLREPDPELRHVARGHSTVLRRAHARRERSHHDPRRDPMDTPAEAIEHLDHAVGELGSRRRCSPAMCPARRARVCTTTSLASTARTTTSRCGSTAVDLGVAFTAHSGSQAIGFRSTTVIHVQPRRPLRRVRSCQSPRRC